MSNWVIKEFKDIAQFPPKISLQKGISYSFIPMEKIDGVTKHVFPNQERVWSGSGGAKFQDGDTLFARITPCLQNGKIAQARNLKNGFGFGSTEYFIFRGVDGVSDTNFIYYLSKTDGFRQNAIGSMVGASGRQRADASFVGQFLVNVPPLTTQTKIAKVLSAYDDLIGNNLKRIKLLEEMAQITYEEWFVRMRFPGHEFTPINPATDLPQGWRKVKLGDVCNLTMGQSPKSEFYNFEEKGFPFHQGVKDYGDRFPTNACWSTSGTRYAERGDVLFSVRAPVGRLNIALEKMILGRGLAAIRHKQNAQGFLYCLLKKQFFEEDMMGGGAIFNSVTKNDMHRIDVVEPSLDILDKYNHLVNATDREIEILHSQNVRLREARDILLPRLMTGVIDVDELMKETA